MIIPPPPLPQHITRHQAHETIQTRKMWINDTTTHDDYAQRPPPTPPANTSKHLKGCTCKVRPQLMRLYPTLTPPLPPQHVITRHETHETSHTLNIDRLTLQLMMIMPKFMHRPHALASHGGLDEHWLPVLATFALAEVQPLSFLDAVQHAETAFLQQAFVSRATYGALTCGALT